MMFPVNRKATELTDVELLNLYDEARRRDLNKVKESELGDAVATVRELRNEIERRMKPCARQHAFSQQDLYQQQLGGQGLGQGLTR